MRACTGMTLVFALLATAGCGSVNAPATARLGDQQAASKPMALRDPGRQSGDLTAADGYNQRSALAEPQTMSDEAPEPRSAPPKSSGLLTPKWAKEAEQDKEEWERDLDRKINNICRGC